MHHQPEPGKKTFLQIVWDVVFVFFYPILTTFALLFVGLVYVISAISRLFSIFTPSKENVIEDKKPEWEPFASCQGFEVEKLFVDEIMFGPSYYRLRARPEQSALRSAYFGEFRLECFGGVLLQQWNTTVAKDLPDYDLVFLHGETGSLQKIQTIKAFSWNAEALDTDTVLVKWFTGTEGGELTLHRKDMVPQASVASRQP